MKKALMYWHPALPANAVSTKPKHVAICGHELVIFRTQSGELAALSDRCPHRHMRLSQGDVKDGCVICPYHGYIFDGQGRGKRPGSPTETINAASYDIVENADVIWVKIKNSPHAFPFQDEPDYSLVGINHYQIKAPFQLLLDNMTELEHTCTVHNVFGFDIEDIQHVETSITNHEDAIDIFYKGPYRKVPLYLYLTTGIGSSDLFIQTAHVQFKPVHTEYVLAWKNPKTLKDSKLKLKFKIFYNPSTEKESSMFAFAYWNRKKWGALGINAVTGWVLGKIIDRELKADIRLIESLPPDTENLTVCQLSRFDYPLLETRKYIANHYYDKGTDVSASPINQGLS